MLGSLWILTWVLQELYGPLLSGLDGMGWDWIGLDSIGFDWMGLDRTNCIRRHGLFFLETFHLSGLFRPRHTEAAFTASATRASLVIFPEQDIYIASERTSERVEERRVFSLVIYGMDWIAKSRNVIYQSRI